MDKKLQRTFRNDRLKDKDKDRGDRKSLNEDETKKLPPVPDRGDLNKTNQKKTSPQKKTENTEQISQSTNTAVVKVKRKKSENVEFRQRVRDRYTLKPKGILKFHRRNEEHFSFVKDDLSTKEKFSKETSELKSTPETKSERSTKLRRLARGKPVVKTSKHAVRPKVVTFVDTNERPLMIRAPEKIVKQLITTRKIVNRGHVTSEVPEKRVKRLKNSKDNRVQLAPSPEISQAAIVSPPTEMAQWTSTTTKHTMPYYEAWVDTTLAAISKLSEDKAYISKRKVMQSFQSELKRTWSPELLYKNINDERYTGKIRVRQK